MNIVSSDIPEVKRVPNFRSKKHLGNGAFGSPKSAAARKFFDAKRAKTRKNRAERHAS